MHQSTKIGYNIQQYYMYVLFHFLKIAMHQVIYFANHVHVFYVYIVLTMVKLEIIRDESCKCLSLT